MKALHEIKVDVDTPKIKEYILHYANQRVIEELESLKKGLIPKIRIKYEIGHYQSKDTQRFIEGVRSSVLEINNRIKELKQE